MNKDTIIFRLKESNSSKILYENKYNAQEFTGILMYPFGFPPIKDSKGKTFSFEIESIQGTPIDSVSASKNKPLTMLSYQYSKEELLDNKALLFPFFVKKFINSVIYTDFIYIVFVYLLPSIFYILWEKLAQKFLNLRLPSIMKFISYPACMILVATVVLDTLFIESFYTGLLFVIIGLWAFLSLALKIESKSFYILIICFILFGMILYLFKNDASAERATMWALVFFSISIGKNFQELYSNKNV
jgi:hypothetical protein